jgi:hypothetical protein
VSTNGGPSHKDGHGGFPYLLARTTNLLAPVIKSRPTSSGYFGGIFHNADAEGMPKENNCPTFEGLDPRTLFREFAAECAELAQTSPSPEKRTPASVWHQMALRWEKVSD